MINQTGGSVLTAILGGAIGYNIGNTSRTQIETMNKIMNTVALNFLVRNSQGVVQKAINENLINISCKLPKEIITSASNNNQICLSYAKNTDEFKNCNEIYKNTTTCNIANISQETLIKWNSDINFTNDVTNNMENLVKQELNKALEDNTGGLKNILDKIGEAVKKSATDKVVDVSIFNNTETLEKIQQELINTYSTSFTAETIQNIKQIFTNSQVLNITSENGVFVSNITQTMAVSVISNIVNNNETYNKMINTIQQALEYSEKSNIGFGATIIIIICLILSCSCCLSLSLSAGAGVWYSSTGKKK